MNNFWHGVPLEQRLKLAESIKDPILFPKNFLGADTWDIQKDILRSVSKPHSRTAVKACHASGKTWVGGSAVLSFLARWTEAIVITTAPTQNQVESIMWPEIHSAIAKSKYPFPKPMLTELKMGPKRYAIGFTTSVQKQDEGVKFQGFHAEHILVVMDEAPGIDPKIWGAVEGIRAGGDVRMLALGNPTITGGQFYEAFHKNRASWNTITISAFDTPNLLGCSLTYKDIDGELITHGKGKDLMDMTEEELFDNQRPYLTTRFWVKEKFIEWGVGHPLWESRVLGNFPRFNEFSLIPLAWLERNRYLVVPDIDDDIIVGIDVAGPGEAETTMFMRRGKKLIFSKYYNSPDPRGEVLADLMPYKHKIKVVRIDSVAIGYNFALHIQDQGYKVAMVNVGESPSDTVKVINNKAIPAKERFMYKKAEYYWSLREKIEAGEVLGLTDEVTIAQLTSIRYEHDSRGRIVIESKKDMRERGVPSPDRAEGLMLCYADINMPWSGLIDYYRVESGLEAVAQTINEMRVQ